MQIGRHLWRDYNIQMIDSIEYISFISVTIQDQVALSRIYQLKYLLITHRIQHSYVPMMGLDLLFLLLSILSIPRILQLLQDFLHRCLLIHHPFLKFHLIIVMVLKLINFVSHHANSPCLCVFFCLTTEIVTGLFYFMGMGQITIQSTMPNLRVIRISRVGLVHCEIFALTFYYLLRIKVLILVHTIR